MALVLFDSEHYEDLLPLVFTRPVGDLRVGIQKLVEKWRAFTDETVVYQTRDYLQHKYGAPGEGEHLYVYGGLCPDDHIHEQIQHLKKGEALQWQGRLLAVRCESDEFSEPDVLNNSREYSGEPRLIRQVYDLFRHNAEELARDFKRITQGRRSAPLSATNTLIGDKIFVEEGAEIEASVLNCLDAPIYIGKNAKILEGCLIRNGLALNEHATLKMGAKIYGATTVGPHCKVGGEVNNCVFHGFSNKGHDGFLGNSVIGEWCNIGADSNNSNLKNNYDEIKIWNYRRGGFAKTGLQFCGLIMGDHSKCGINTMFNTGTVVGVSANVYGSGFPRNFIPSFSWGGAAGFTEYRFEKAMETAGRMMSRRSVALDEPERDILRYVFDKTADYR